jgi:hypothetical protein
MGDSSMRTGRKKFFANAGGWKAWMAREIGHPFVS